MLRRHLNAVSSFKLGEFYKVLVAIVLPIVLSYTLLSWITTTLKEGYGDFPAHFLGIFGWGMMGLVIVLAVGLSLLPWSATSGLNAEESVNEDLAAELVYEDGTPVPSPTGELPVVAGARPAAQPRSTKED